MANPQKENGYTAIANEIMEALAKIDMPSSCRQMLDVIFRKTYGFNKKSDSISTMQFIKATGLSRRTIERSRQQLAKMRIISTVKSGGTVKHVGRACLSYLFIKDYEKWRSTVKPVSTDKVVAQVPTKNVRLYNTKDNIQKKTRGWLHPHLSFFLLKHKEETGVNYDVAYARDNVLFKDLEKKYSAEDIKAFITDFFNEGRKETCWWADKLSVPVFKKVIPNLIGIARKKL